jgi:hypothetical protein
MSGTVENCLFFVHFAGQLGRGRPQPDDGTFLECTFLG